MNVSQSASVSKLKIEHSHDWIPWIISSDRNPLVTNYPPAPGTIGEPSGLISFIRRTWGRFDYGFSLKLTALGHPLIAVEHCLSLAKSSPWPNTFVVRSYVVGVLCFVQWLIELLWCIRALFEASGGLRYLRVLYRCGFVQLCWYCGLSYLIVKCLHYNIEFVL